MVRILSANSNDLVGIDWDILFFQIFFFFFPMESKKQYLNLLYACNCLYMRAYTLCMHGSEIFYFYLRSVSKGVHTARTKYAIVRHSILLTAVLGDMICSFSIKVKEKGQTIVLGQCVCV